MSDYFKNSSQSDKFEVKFGICTLFLISKNYTYWTHQLLSIFLIETTHDVNDLSEQIRSAQILKYKNFTVDSIFDNKLFLPFKYYLKV